MFWGRQIHLGLVQHLGQVHGHCLVTHIVHPCLGTEGCQSSSPYCLWGVSSGARQSHSRSCTGKQEVSRNGKQSHCHHRVVNKHIFKGVHKRRHLILPFPPAPPLNTPAPCPAVRAEKGGVFFPVPCLVPFQRSSELPNCLCITLFTCNCYLVTLNQEQSLNGNKAQ